MSRPEAIEVIVMSAVTSETKANGKVRKVTFLLPNDGDHPFSGMIGEHLHIVPVRISEDETTGDAPVQDEEGRTWGLPDQQTVGLRTSSSAPRKAWADLPPSQQAAIRCTEAEFQRYVRVESEAAAADDVRVFCGVTSRKDLDTNHRARVIWFGLDRAYMEATGRLAVAR